MIEWTSENEQDANDEGWGIDIPNQKIIAKGGPLTCDIEAFEYVYSSVILHNIPLCEKAIEFIHQKQK